MPDLESGDPGVMNFDRNGNLCAGGNGAFEQGRFQDLGSDLGFPGGMYDPRGSPPRDRGALFHDFSPQQLPRQGPFHDDAWDLPEDALLFHGAKKLKTNSLPPKNQLPEYPLSQSQQMKHMLPRVPDKFLQHEALDKDSDYGRFGYNQIPDHAKNFSQPYGDRSDHWNPPRENLSVVSVPLPSNPVEWSRLTPEARQSSPNEVWKWEGTIAKGGTPVCHARCFPVGKMLDMILPEFLDCTARTGLDMLAKHYYQAASAWVVFFVPQSDADIRFYNEFMNYLGEKQRAAVAKLDEKATLFLVPPSEFSETVLKVPGKLSISGVILRLEHPGSTLEPLNPPPEIKDTNFMPFHHGNNPSDQKLTTPVAPYPPPLPSFPNFGQPGTNSVPFPGNLLPAPPVPFSVSAHPVRSMLDAVNENKQEQMLHQRNPALGSSNWSPHQPQPSNVSNHNIVSQASSSNTIDPAHSNSVMPRDIGPGYNNYAMPRSAQETSLGNYAIDASGTPLSGSSSKLPFQDNSPPVVSSSVPVPAALQPDQLAQLASSLLGQRRQPVGVSIGDDFRQPTYMNQSQNSYGAPQNFGLPNNQPSFELSSSHFSQMQHFHHHQQPQQQQQQPPQQQQQMLNITVMPPAHAQMNQQLQNAAGAQDEGDADPQRRLQATLQLAAALLQQIQRGNGN